MSEPKPVAWLVERVCNGTVKRQWFLQERGAVDDALARYKDRRWMMRVIPLYPGPFRVEITHSACASSVDGLRTRYRRLVSEWEHDPSNP